MVELIVGEKGKGKTKHLLDRAEADLKTVQGNIIFVDKDQKHIFGLHGNIRLIDMTDFDVNSTEAFMGFLNGIISQNYDIEEIILDSFLTIAGISEDDAMVDAVEQLEALSKKFKIRFLLSVSRKEAELPAALKERVIIAV